MSFRSVMLLMAIAGVMPAESQERLLVGTSAAMKRTMTVEELFQLVESNSKTLQEQKISVEFAQKGLEAAHARRLPELNASLSAAYNGNVVVTDRDLTNAHGFSSPHYAGSFAVEAQQVLYAGGAIDAGIRMAELERDMAQTAQRSTLNAQRFMALGQYLDLFKVQNGMQVYEQNIALTQRLIGEIQEKQAQGMALMNDVTRYELQMETLRLGLRRLQDEQAILNHQLCNTLGLDESEELRVKSEDFAAAIPFPEGTTVGDSSLNDWQQTALASSPQMEQSLLSTRMAEQQLRQAKSEMLPKVALVAADNFSGPFTYDLPPIDKNINYWYVGVGVRYSLGSLWKQNKKVRQAVTGVRRSQWQQQVVAESLDNQVQQAWTLWQQTYADLDTQRKSVQLARQNYRVVSERYLNQLALITDMLDASNIRLNAELQEVNARINIIYAYYKLKYIAGTLTIDH